MGQHPADDVDQIDAMEREIDTLRRRTEDLMAELERRVETRVDGAKHTIERVKYGLQRARDAADVPAHVRAHPRAAAGVGAGTLVAIGVGIWLLATRRAENRRLGRRLQRRAGAYRALLAHPERALAPRGPSMSKRLVGAMLVATASTLTRRFIAAQMR